MCLMLYVATAADLPAWTTPDLTVEEVDEARAVVRRWFSLPTVRFVGAHTGCSCGFPHVIAEEAIEYFDAMFAAEKERTADVRSVRSLIALIRQLVEQGQPVELYPVWDGDEDKPPKGKVEWHVESLAPDQFFFNERFMHVASGR
jgi:hypothetical protein